MATAKIAITATDYTKQGTASAKKNIQSLKDTVDSFSAAIKATAIAGVAVTAIKKLGDTATTCVNNFSEAQRSYEQMRLSFNSTAEYERALGLIDKFSRISLTSATDIGKITASLAAMGKSVDEIDKITEASIALSNVTGKDLKGSMEALLGSLSGSAGDISKYVPEVTKLTKAELEAGGAIKLVTKNLGAMSEELASSSFAQTTKNIQDHFDSISESIGGIITNNLSGVMDWLDARLETIDDYFKRLKDQSYVDPVKKATSASIAASATTSNLNPLYQYSIDELIDALKATRTGKGMFQYRDYSNYAEASTWSYSKLLDIVNSTKHWLVTAEDLDNALALVTVIDAKLEEQNGISNKLEGAIGNSVDELLAEKDYFRKVLNVKTITPTELEDQANDIYKKWKQTSLDQASELITALSEYAVDNSTESKIRDIKLAIQDVYKAMQDLASNGLVDSDTYKTLTLINSNLTAELSELKKQNTATSDKDNGASLESTVRQAVANLNSQLGLEGLPFDFLNNLISSYKSTFNSDKADNNILQSLDNSFTELLNSVAPLTDLFLSTAPELAILEPIIEGFANTVAPALNTVVNLLISSLTDVGESLGSMIMPIIEALAPIMQTLGDIIREAVIPIIESLTPLISIVASLFQALQGPLTMIGKVFTVVATVIQWVADSITWVIGSFLNWISGLNIFGWKPLAWLNVGEVKDPGNLFQNISDNLAKIDETISKNYGTDYGLSGASDSSSQSIQNATYTGAVTVTMNIYQNGVVVGQSGMQEFAQMMRNEFLALDYYGR